MARLLKLLTSFAGRISRAQFWLGLALVLVATVAGSAFVNPSAYTSGTVMPPSLAENVVVLISFWPMMAITIKRLNDRDWPSWVGIAAGLVFLPWYIGPFLGAFDIVAMMTGTASKAQVWYSYAVLAVATVVLIDNGFLRGTDGLNRYGPDPLERRPV